MTVVTLIGPTTIFNWNQLDTTRFYNLMSLLWEGPNNRKVRKIWL